MIDFFKRLDRYMRFKGLNDNKMTVKTGISNGLIGKARKRGSLSQENISKILYAYLDLDANWLLTGKGEMIKKENEDVPEIDLRDRYIIDLQKDKIEALEKKVKQLKTELESETGYGRVAEPDP